MAASLIAENYLEIKRKAVSISLYLSNQTFTAVLQKDVLVTQLTYKSRWKERAQMCLLYCDIVTVSYKYSLDALSKMHCLSNQKVIM